MTETSAATPVAAWIAAAGALATARGQGALRNHPAWSQQLRPSLARLRGVERRG